MVEYFDNLAALAQVEPIDPITFEVFIDVLGNYYQDARTYKDFNYKLISNETFQVCNITNCANITSVPEDKGEDEGEDEVED